MPALVLLFITLFFLSGPLGDALAEDTFEIRQKKGLFLFEDFQHWTNFQYRFSDHDSNQNSGSTSSSHAFKESYNINLIAAIYDPHLFDANLQAGILYDQNVHKSETATSSGTDFTLQYNFSGIGLDKSPTPFTLLSFRNRIIVDNTYSPPTTSDNTGNAFALTIRNGLLQSGFNYARNTSDTWGGGYDSSTVSNSYSYTATHSFGDISETTVAVAFSDQSGRGANGSELEASTNQVNFTNSFSLGSQKNYSLQTMFQLNNANIDNNVQRNLNFSESMLARPGKAMQLQATYMLADNRNTDTTGHMLEIITNSGELAFKHKLYKSLETTLRAKSTFNDLVDGTEKIYDIMGGIRYSKLLPADSQIVVGVSKDHETVDRRLKNATTTVLDEPHANVHQGDTIELPLADATLRSVISVKSRAPIFTYVEGVDYTVNYTLGRIDIRAGSGVRIDMDGTGMELYISYEVLKEPLTKFTNDSLYVNSDLSLLTGKLQLGASYTEAQQRSLSGPVTNNLSGDSRTFMVYVGGIHDNYNYRVSFRDAVTRGQAYRSIDGNINANWDFEQSSLSFTGRNRFNKYDANLNSVGYSENSAEMSAAYVKNILSNMRLTLHANFIDIRSDMRGASDSLSLRAGYLIDVGKLVVKLSGQTALSLNKNVATRDDIFHIDVTRYF